MSVFQLQTKLDDHLNLLLESLFFHSLVLCPVYFGDDAHDFSLRLADANAVVTEHTGTCIMNHAQGAFTIGR